LNELFELLQEGVRRTRQHHAIEHATLHVLAARYPQHTFAGYSDPLGFIVLGNVDSFALRRAVGDAMLRLQGGETHLAIHSNCGTMLASTALLAAFAALVGSTGQRTPLARFTSMVTWVLGALVVSRPLGLRLQRWTTLAEISDRWLVEVRPLSTGRVPMHRVIFE
jgi:hypothetical protein